MATSSIHIEAGANGYFAHNSRESKTVNSIFDDEKNFCSCTNAQAFETYKKNYLQERMRILKIILLEKVTRKNNYTFICNS